MCIRDSPRTAGARPFSQCRPCSPWTRTSSNASCAPALWTNSRQMCIRDSINYCLTTMGAMEFRLKASQDRAAAWADYLRLCQVGGSKSYLETLAYANLSVPFEPGTVERACGFAREELLGAEA